VLLALVSLKDPLLSNFEKHSLNFLGIKLDDGDALEAAVFQITEHDDCEGRLGIRG
jgi:hypothetical protein